jgi:hypothetical protein
MIAKPPRCQMLLVPSEVEMSAETWAHIKAAMQSEIDAQAARFFYGKPKPHESRCKCKPWALVHEPTCPLRLMT